MKRLTLAAVTLTLLLNSCMSTNPRATTHLNTASSFSAEGMPFNPQQARVITSSIDRRNHTMSTFFGNDAAVNYARMSEGRTYPKGASLALVTWKQVEDERWFGGSIPSTPLAIEFVTVSGSTPIYSYRKYEGSPLKESAQSEGATLNDRLTFLLSQRAAVMP